MSEIDDALTGRGSEIDDALGGPAKKSSSAGRRIIGDTAIALGKGIIGVPEAAVGLADIVSGGKAGKIAEDAVGFRPKEAKKVLDTFLTPEQQAANAAVQSADGFVPAIAASVENPSTIIQGAVESGPSMFMGGALARAASKVVPAIGPITASAMGEGAVSAGQTAEQIRQETANGELTPAQAAIAAGSGAFTGALTRVGGKVAEKLGISDVDTMLAGGKAATAPVKKGILRRGAEGAISEGVLEELPQSAQEQAAQNIALGKPVGEGVGNAAATGMLTGGLIGGGTGAAFHGDHNGVAEPKVSMPGDHPEINPADGPISAAARVAVDSGAAAAEQTKNLSAAAEEYQAQASKGEFGPEQEAKALAALEKQSSEDIKAMRDFTSSAPAPSDAPESEVMRALYHSARKEEETASRDKVFAFPSEEAAQRRADAMAKKTGQPHDVVPHPVKTGKFAVQPRATVDVQAHEAATSPQNERAVPSEAQAEAGNYKKGHARISGLDISIENPEGSKRRPEWPTLKSHYGYIRGTIGKDKDHVDVFVKPGTPEDFSGTVFVVDQRKADGSFDEHKVMLGYDDIDQAKGAYRENFTKGWKGLGAISAMPLDEFKDWVRDPSRTTQPVAPVRAAATSGEQSATPPTAGQQATAAEDAASAAPSNKERLAITREERATARARGESEGKVPPGEWQMQEYRHDKKRTQGVANAEYGIGQDEHGKWHASAGRMLNLGGESGHLTGSWDTPEEAKRAALEQLTKIINKPFTFMAGTPGEQASDTRRLEGARQWVEQERKKLGLPPTGTSEPESGTPAPQSETNAPKTETNAPENETPAPERAKADYSEYAGREVVRKLDIDTGETATLRLKAPEALAAVDERIDVLKELARCLA
jgi:hypothetical protein